MQATDKSTVKQECLYLEYSTAGVLKLVATLQFSMDNFQHDNFNTSFCGTCIISPTAFPFVKQSFRQVSESLRENWENSHYCCWVRNQKWNDSVCASSVTSFVHFHLQFSLDFLVPSTNTAWGWECSHARISVWSQWGSSQHLKEHLAGF